MNLVDLIKQVGDENICTQNLSECVRNYRSSKHGTLITFGTNAVSPTEVMFGKEKKIGIIIWFDKEAYKKAFESEK